MMLLWQSFLMVDRLLRGMVVILVDLSVDGGCSFLMLLASDVLMLHGGVDLLVDSRIVLARLPQKALDRILSFVHRGSFDLGVGLLSEFGYCFKCGVEKCF